MVLGPATLVRPFVIIGAGLYGAMHANSGVAVVFCIAASGTQLCVEPLLNRAARRGEQKLKSPGMPRD